jgi:DNA repair protein RecO (recombination protein O)
MKKKTTSRFFDFLEAALLWLDNHDEINFHLILMLETTKYLGFISTSDMDMPFLEMTEV